MARYMQHEGLDLPFAFSRSHLYNLYKLVDEGFFVCLFCLLCVDPGSKWVQERTEHLS